MNKKLKLLVAVSISFLPINSLRVFLYKKVFNYNISKSNIGFGTILVVQNCSLENVSIGKFNFFIGPFSLRIAKNTHIGSFNKFRCGSWVVSEEFKEMNFKHTLEIGENSSIGDKHFFDVSSLIKIGNNSWIAGNSSQFWTHGGDKKNNDIIIGNDCYIGSGVMFAPGSGVADNSIVAMGAIVTKRYKKENTLISPPSMRTLQFDPNKNPLFNS